MSASPSPAAESDEFFMRRAFALAARGRGRVEPNPLVGCVLVQAGRTIAEGYHTGFGGPHAEADALSKTTEDPAGATAYVTLEPCCHTNKKTPPCVPRLIEAKIARVVVGCLDPNPAVNGKGIAMLREAGVRVDGPLLENHARQLIAPFLARVLHHRPYVTLKWAQSADGKIAGPGGKPLQITGPEATRFVHQQRAASDAIAVGINTVLSDDPLLSARDVPSARPLRRVVLDSSLRFPLECRLALTAGRIPTSIYCQAAQLDSSRASQLKSLGIEVTQLQGAGPAPGSRLPLRKVLQREPGTHLLVEPGPTLAEGFFAENAADRLWVFRSGRSINGASAPAAAGVPAYFQQVGELRLGSDTLIEYLNARSEVFFAPDPSPELSNHD